MAVQTAHVSHIGSPSFGSTRTSNQSSERFRADTRPMLQVVVNQSRCEEWLPKTSL